MSTENDLILAANRLYDDAGVTLNLLESKVQEEKTAIAALVATGLQYLTATQGFAVRAEAAGGSNPSTGVDYLLHLSEVSNGQRSTNWVNSVTGGPVFNNKGSGTAGGAIGSITGPWNLGAFGESTTGGPTAITSAETVTRASTFFSEGYIYNPDNALRSIWQYSTDGSDNGGFRIRLLVTKEGDNAGFQLLIRLNNVGLAGLTIAATVAPAQIAGMTGIGCFHWVVQREADNRLSLRVNGNLLGTTTESLPGSLTGYMDAFGSYDRTYLTADGCFRAQVSELRGGNGLKYSGSTYTVPVSRFTG